MYKNIKGQSKQAFPEGGKRLFALFHVLLVCLKILVENIYYELLRLMPFSLLDQADDFFIMGNEAVHTPEAKAHFPKNAAYRRKSIHN